MRARTLVLTLTLAACSSGPTTPNPDAGGNTAGTLDTSFGDQGIAELTSSAAPALTTMARQADDSLLLGGYTTVTTDNTFWLARIAADGSVDLAFGTDGETSGEVSHAVVQAITVRSDGKIIVAGGARYSGVGEMVLARYDASGSLDATSFGTDGSVRTTVASDAASVNAVALQSDGRILAAGSSQNVAEDRRLTLTRYTADGVLDTSFDSAATPGIVQADLSGDASALAMVVDSANAKVVVGGYAFGTANNDFMMQRYLTSADAGTLDQSFGTLGTAMTDIAGQDDAINALALLNDHQVLAAGAGSAHGALVRYLPDTGIAWTFGDDGMVLDARVSEFQGLAVQGDGKIIVAGTSHGSGTFVFRYNEDGSPDTSFGDEGAALVEGFPSLVALVLQSDGKIILAGEDGATIKVARLLP